MRVAVELRKLRVQLVERRELVFQFDSAELQADRGRKFLAAIRGSAIVDRENREAFVRQNLVEERRRSTPGILHRLPRRTAIDVHDERNLLACIRIARQNQIAIQHRAVIGFEFQRLRRDQIVIGHAAPFPDFLAGAARRAHRNPRRRQRRGMRFHEMLAVIGETGGIVAFFRRNALHRRAVQLHGKNLLLSRISFVGGEENRARCFIHPADRDHLIVSAFELAFEFGIGGQRILAH